MSHEGPKISRRNLLKGAGALIAVASVGGIAEEAIRRTKHSEAVPTAPTHVEPVSFTEYLSNPQAYAYDMGELEGMHFGYPLDKFIGIEGRIPKIGPIDFRGNLAELLKEKNDLIGTREGRENLQVLFETYNPETADRMSLAEYERRIGNALEEVRLRDMNQIKRLESFAHFDDTQIELLRRLEAKITPRILLTYALTEIIATKGPHCKAGVAAFGFLVEKAGANYVALLPALYDSLLSFGPYQFTENALLEYETIGARKVDGKMVHEKIIHRNGASRINHILPQSQIPASVAELRGDEHHKAAYLFALYNLACLVNRLGSHGSDTPAKLLKYFDEMPPDTILEFIATAHHLPGKAINAFQDLSTAFVRF